MVSKGSLHHGKLPASRSIYHTSNSQRLWYSRGYNSGNHGQFIPRGLNLHKEHRPLPTFKNIQTLAILIIYTQRYFHARGRSPHRHHERLFLKDYVDFRCKDTGPSVMKALVWSLRKFWTYRGLAWGVKNRKLA